MGMQIDKHDLFQRGIYVERMTAAERLRGLISRLHPVVTRHDLVRVGSDHDGGYLVPNVLDGIGACFSPGVADNASFEQAIHEKWKIPSHLADKSVDGPPEGFSPLSFTKKFVGSHDDDSFLTLESWIRAAGEAEERHDLMLQMDIEGGEYLALISATEQLLQRFRVAVIEFHCVESWGHFHFFELVEAVFTKLLRSHVVVHLHPNNCCGLVNLGGVFAPRVFEATLLRRDVGEVVGRVTSLPHALDRPNLLDREDILLPPIWYLG